MQINSLDVPADNMPVNTAQPIAKRDDYDPAEVAAAIEDGSLFKEARDWYTAMYIGPISERVFFIVITSVAVVVCVMALLALAYLLPIKPRIPFVYYTKDIVGRIPTMTRFKEADEPSNPALIRYYLGALVTSYESYTEKKYFVNRSFMKYYGDEEMFAEYDRATNPSNPRSPIRTYGKYTEVKVNIENVTYERPATGPARGVVEFSTELVSPDSRKKTNWTATIGFYYTDLVAGDQIDPETGEITLSLQEPTFQAVSYDVKERLVLPEKEKP